MTTTRADAARLLPDLFDAERNVRRVHAELAQIAPSALLDALEPAVRESLDLHDESESALRLVRLASLLGDMDGARAVDLLIDILGSDEPEARHSAGEALEDLAFERFKEVALGVERALDRLPRGNSALLELPYLLAGVGEPGVRKLLARFLTHEDPEAVAAAIEVLVETEDTGAAALLAPLERDARTVSLEDEAGEEGTATIGELAIEARALLAEVSGEGHPENPTRAGKGSRR